jgi:hypothetical protein
MLEEGLDPVPGRFGEIVADIANADEEFVCGRTLDYPRLP